MSIWYRELSLEVLNGYAARDVSGHLGLRYTGFGADYLRACIAVTPATQQAYGLWHGGVSCVVAEAMGSVGCALCLNPETHYCVGVEINASHLRSATDGEVYAQASPLRIGRRMHVWEIRLSDGDDKLMCVSRLSTAVLAR